MRLGKLQSQAIFPPFLLPVRKKFVSFAAFHNNNATMSDEKKPMLTDEGLLSPQERYINPTPILALRSCSAPR